jgi:hypothetical protein
MSGVLGPRPYALHHRKTVQAGPEALSPSSLPIPYGATISYPWLVEAYRSSSSAYRGYPLKASSGLAVQPYGPHKGAVCKTVGLLKKGIRKTPDVAPLPNPAVYENQGGAFGAAGVPRRAGWASRRHAGWA